MTQFNGVIKCQVVGEYPLLVDCVHEDQELRQCLQLIVGVLVVNVVPVVVEEPEDWTEKLEQDSTGRETVEGRW